ncbi:hypothetical protein J6P11_02440 [bacterium]|nr:hypothetical protein [bacterium]
MCEANVKVLLKLLHFLIEHLQSGLRHYSSDIGFMYIKYYKLLKKEIILRILKKLKLFFDIKV